MGEPLASAKTDVLHYEVIQGAAPMGARPIWALEEMVRRAKRATLFARQLKRIQAIGADDSLGLLEAYQQMREVAEEISNPRAESMVSGEESARERVFAAVHAERERQTEKWGDQWGAGNTPPETKLAILMEEVGEVAKEVLEGGEQHPSLREELVQCAAVCTAWLESLDGEARS